MTHDEAIPQVLYKYRNWGDELHRKILTDGQIYFPSPAKLNDPFDSTIDPVFELLRRSEALRRAQMMFRREERIWSGTRVRKEAQRAVKAGFGSSPDSMATFKAEFLKRRVTEFGIFSLSATIDSNLLWSHYAKEHTGFCVGFSTERITAALNEWAYQLQIGVMAGERVRYESKYPRWNVWDHIGMPHIEAFKELIVKSVTRKSSEWSHEREYRYIIFGRVLAGCRKARVPVDAMREVYLGCKMLKQHQAQIVECIRRYPHDVRLFKAKKVESFKLAYEEVPY